MGEWHEFFLAQAGAAGVLVGLVFVGVSINLEKILSDPGSGLTGRAAEALILLVAVLTASALLLVPAQGTTMIGAEVLAVGLAHADSREPPRHEVRGIALPRTPVNKVCWARLRLAVDLDDHHPRAEQRCEDRDDHARRQPVEPPKTPRQHGDARDHER